MATSVAIPVGDIGDELVQQTVDYAKTLSVGPTDQGETVDMGPGEVVVNDNEVPRDGSGDIAAEPCEHSVAVNHRVELERLADGYVDRVLEIIDQGGLKGLRKTINGSVVDDEVYLRWRVAAARRVTSAEAAAQVC